MGWSAQEKSLCHSSDRNMDICLPIYPKYFPCTVLVWWAPIQVFTFVFHQTSQSSIPNPWPTSSHHCTLAFHPYWLLCWPMSSYPNLSETIFSLTGSPRGKKATSWSQTFSVNGQMIKISLVTIQPCHCSVQAGVDNASTYCICLCSNRNLLMDTETWI